nr:glycoside hydrolase family 127 protein [Salipaludibacillus agaradhaerens]
MLNEFALHDVTITDGPIKKAMALNEAYLLELEPDRLLSRYREYAGLKPKAPNYKGWEDKGISGHTLGHYLSACAMMWAATGNKDIKERVTYIVDELALCQKSDGDGFISGIPRGKEIFEEVRAGNIISQGFDLNGGWVPLYSLHKVFAGLRDAYYYADNKKALDVEKKLGEWLARIVNPLNEAQLTALLRCEYGGMNEVLVDLAEDTKNDTFLALANKFYHKPILDPLKEQKDTLAGNHANTQIPKVIGLAKKYEATGDENSRGIAEFFWERVVNHHSYVIGGHSYAEHFGEPDRLNARLGAATCETCNTYNMLKLTRHTFKWNQLAEQADYYERALFNHILASQHPEDGRVNYFLSLDMGGQKDYRSKFGEFSCCVGTGMENHASYGKGIYYYSEKSLFITQYLPSTLKWQEYGVEVIQKTAYPEDEHINVAFHTDQPIKLAVNLRVPYWAEKGVEVTINGAPMKVNETPSQFITIERVWSQGDTIDLTLPMSLRIETMPDNTNRMAFMYGPLVLAGEVNRNETTESDDRLSEVFPVPVLISEKGHLLDHFHKDKQSFMWKTDGIGYPHDVHLIPFYQMHDHHYTVYWDVFSKKEWQKAEKEYKLTMEQQRFEEERTVDVVQPGEMQPERDHDFKGEHVSHGSVFNRAYRSTWKNGWFSFELAVLPAIVMQLVVTYPLEEDDTIGFDIFVDEQCITNDLIRSDDLNQFTYSTYLLPYELTKGKEHVTIMFKSRAEHRVAKVSGISTVKRHY